MTELSMIMDWCNTNNVTLELMYINGNSTFYNGRISMFFDDENYKNYKAVFVFKSNINGSVENKAVYRFYENGKTKTTTVFDDFGLDLLEMVYHTIKIFKIDCYDDFVDDDFEN